MYLETNHEHVGCFRVKKIYDFEMSNPLGLFSIYSLKRYNFNPTKSFTIEEAPNLLSR